MLVAGLVTPAHGAIGASVPINEASLEALLAGRDVCGDEAHVEACLVVIDCDEVDELVECSKEEPRWTPSLVQVTGKVTGNMSIGQRWITMTGHWVPRGTTTSSARLTT